MRFFYLNRVLQYAGVLVCYVGAYVRASSLREGVFELCLNGKMKERDWAFILSCAENCFQVDNDNLHTVPLLQLTLCIVTLKSLSHPLNNGSSSNNGSLSQGSR